MNEERRDAPTLVDLRAFATIAARRSFRQAADDLAVSPSTLSHMMRGLEQRMAVRLLNRTTRSVSTTEAGERLLARLGPVLRDLDQALDEVATFRSRPAGTLRINANETGARMLLDGALGAFRAEHPDVQVDIVTDGAFVDIVEKGFDAGLRLIESIPDDMVIVPYGGETRFVMVASPAYLAARGSPNGPKELAHHECIRIRMPSGKRYRWELEKRGREVTLDVPGALTLDSIPLMVEAARAGIGIGYVPERAARSLLDAGELAIVLDDWCPHVTGMALYYPGHRHVPPALRAFIDVLKRTDVARRRPKRSR